MTELNALRGIGEKTAKLYGKLGIDTVESAVFYFPRDYVKYEPITPPEEFSTDVMIAFEAVVVKRPLVRHVKKLSITTVTLSAGNQPVSATWFNMPYLAQSLKPGAAYIFRGKLSVKGDQYHMEQPGIFTKDHYEELLGHINPIYSLTKGLTNNAVTSTIKKAFDFLDGNYSNEVYQMHFPKDEETLRQAREKLVYEEFLAFILRLRLMRKAEEAVKNDFNIMEVAECRRIIEKLPYRLTAAQEKVWSEISSDLCSEKSMRRLVQGDVGSGKTILATLAAVMVAVNGYQSAIMAPTEILANQHYESIKRLLAGILPDIKVVLLTGAMSVSARKNVYEMIGGGEASIIIGTHALFQEKVTYNNLALVVTDEQHRFGVGQRSLLTSKNKESNCHVLVMSATPIPRTLAIIMYGDLDISVLDEVPSHRKPVKNAVVGESYRKKAYEFFEKEINAGHQVYVICPLIEESEGLEAKNVTDTVKELNNYYGGRFKIGMLHGRLGGEQKQRIMESFAKGGIDILVSTTVVEVGVNVPNATVMMIENSDRFGLAALHQLRGRIGRGDAQSYCIFMTSGNPEKNKRLEVLKSTNDGFKIAEEDLKLRGPGDMFGFRQSGDVRFVLADIYTDAALLKKASDEASRIIASDPGLKSEENKRLAQMVFQNGELTDIASSM